MFVGASIDLRPTGSKRMQGKTCFNCTTVEDALFRELEHLTAHGLAVFKSARFITS